ncbi:hypothetical protein GALL_254270 [mine drainage metagenome]|uniref:Chemoreceptor zinc-binding domain-containing protein n=1 Tax=mine drainage metagenome TaxID=410659 RepID=A0A1J5RKH4_9ZZZZ
MINKKLALHSVLKAKASHLKWLSYAQGMVDGIDCPLDSIPIQSTECEFGKWYYGEGREMLAELVLFHALEPPHEILHSLYKKIYELVQQRQMDEARKHMPGFLEVSRNLLETISFLEQEIDSFPPNH